MALNPVHSLTQSVPVPGEHTNDKPNALLACLTVTEYSRSDHSLIRSH